MLKKTLPNGLRLISKEMKNSPVTSIQIWVETGALYENAKTSGISHFIEHMFFKGTKKNAPGAMAQYIETLGGNINAFTSYDYTVYTLSIPSRHTEKGYQILADAFLNSTFATNELEKEKKVVIEEISMGNDEPDSIVKKELFKQAFATHPYARQIIGTKENIISFKRKDLINYIANNYVPSNCIIVTVGNLPHEDAEKLAKKYFSKLEAKPSKNKLYYLDKQTKTKKISCLTRNINEAIFTIGFQIPGILHEDLFALDVLALILGQGNTSRLYKKLKTEDGLVNNIAAHSLTLKENGLFLIDAKLVSKDLKKVIAEVFKICQELKEKPLGSDEIQRSLIVTERNIIFQSETAQGIARQIGSFEALLKNPEFNNVYIEKLRQITSDDIYKVANKYLNYENMNIALIAKKDKFYPTESFIKSKAQILAKKQQISLNTGNGQLIRTSSPNGIRYIFNYNPSHPIVSCKSFFTGGLRYEDENNNGISHLMSALMLKGTKKRSVNDLAEEIVAAGAFLKSEAGRNSTSVGIDILSRNFEKGIEILSDVIRNSIFPEKELINEAKQALYAIRSIDDHPTQAAFKFFLRKMYGNHPYSMDILGSENSLPMLNQNAIKDYHKSLITPDNMVLAISGDIHPDKAFEICQKYFSGWKLIKTLHPTLREIPKKSNAEVYEKILDKEQAHVILGFDGVSFNDKRRFSLDILNSILTGQGGRLFQRLRDELSLAYSVGSMNVEGIEPGYLAIYIACAPENIDLSIKEIKNILNSIATKGVSDKEIERAKMYIIGNYENELQLNSVKAIHLGFNELYNMGYKNLNDYSERILNLSNANIRSTIGNFLKGDYIISILKPLVK
ncbi:MAG: pitrilysin family protein [Pseudomonadota bacterium]